MLSTPRDWDQRERFDQAWALLAAHYQLEVDVIANVVALRPQPLDEPKRSRRAAAAR